MNPRPSRTAVAIKTHGIVNVSADTDRRRSPACHIECHRFVAHPIIGPAFVRALAQRTYQTKLTAHRSTKMKRSSRALNVEISSVAEDCPAGELTFGNADHAGERIISLLG